MGRLILTGSSRCGTTVTRHILSRHPDINKRKIITKEFNSQLKSECYNKNIFNRSIIL